MASENQEINKATASETRTLPKNYRQIGDPGNKKIYIEDYVYTYLNKLARPGNIYARGAILFGNIYKTEGGKSLFISGGCACQNFEFDLEHTTLTEENWKEIYRIRDEFFKEQEVVGWFLSRMGFSVELNDKIIRAHLDNFGGEYKVLYMVDALEEEDAFYQFEDYALKRQPGYYIYYEPNEAMKAYMQKEDAGTSPEDQKEKAGTLGRDAAVIHHYKKLLKQKKIQNKKNGGRGRSSLAAAAVVALAVVLYGAYSIRQFRNHYDAEETFGAQETTLSQEDWTAEASSDLTEGTTREVTDESFYEQEISTQVLEEALKEETTEDDGGTEPAGTTEFTGTTESGETTESEETIGSAETGTYSEDSGEDSTQVFTQEEPDDAQEAWSYIGGYYTVQKGDTLAGISRKIFQSYDYIIKIAEENGIVNIDQIYPGQILYIPEMED